METLEVGMYVRNDYFGIGKINRLYKDQSGKVWYNVKFKYYGDNENHCGICEQTKGFKASHNIIDLIEENDIILGKDGNIYQVDNVINYHIFTKNFNDNGETIVLFEHQIDKVLTKEQFENNCCRVGD